MPTLVYHHRKRLILKKLTDYVRMRRQIIQSLTLNNQSMLEKLDDDDQEDDIPMQPGADLPFDRIPFMSKAQRERLRNQFPNLPPYMFMTEKEKVAYFKKKSFQFSKNIEHASQRKSKTKKIVKFSSNFEVRPFRKIQKANQVTNTKSFMDTYRQYHFS